MFYLMPTRNESVVYYDSYVKADKLIEFMEKYKDNDPKITLTHILLKACSLGMKENPKMNQYVSGHNLYQRENIEISFSLKKKKETHSVMKVVKLNCDDQEETLSQLAKRINDRLGVERSNKKTYTDKEIHLVTLMPRFLLRFLVKFLRWLDYYNLLPYSFIKNDPLYSSLFIANLGSIGMDSAYHHLYEYGTIPLFMTVGKIQEMPVVEDGKVVVGKRLHIRWSYDERIDDGLTSGKGINSVVRILEDPFKYIHI